MGYLSVQLGFWFGCYAIGLKHFRDPGKNYSHTMKFECAIGTKRMHDMMGTPIRDLGHDKRKVKKVKQLIGLRRCVKYKVSSS